MASDTYKDWKSGENIGTTKERRKLDLLIEFIKDGNAVNKSGSGIEARYNALNQVLKSSHATPTQKADALKAFYTELGSAAAIDASFHIDVFRGLFVRGVGDDQGNRACKGLLAALNQNPSVFSLANLKAIESSLNTSGGLSGDKVISLQNRVKELISQKVTEENLKHIGNSDLSSGKRVSAFLDILKDEGVSPENKDKAFDALLEALEKDGFHPGLENLENIRSSLFNENGEKASLLRGKVQVAVNLDSIDKSKSVDENIGFCLDVCKSVNASPKQKSEACEKLASILKDIQEERFTDDQLSHIDRILGARGVDSKSLSDERGLISARRDLYVLKTGMLPGTSGLGGSAHASIEDRLNAFFSILKNGKAGDSQKEIACDYLENFLKEMGPEFSGISTSQAHNIRVQEGRTPSLQKLASHVYEVRHCEVTLKNHAEASMTALVALSPEQVGKMGVTGYQKALDAAIRGQQQYESKAIKLGLKPVKNERLTYLSEHFSKLKQALDGGTSVYMKMLKNAGMPPLKRVKHSNGLVASIDIPRARLESNALEMFQMRAARDTLDWSEVDFSQDPGKLDVTGVLLSAAYSIPNFAESYLA